MSLFRRYKTGRLKEKEKIAVSDTNILNEKVFEYNFSSKDSGRG